MYVYTREVSIQDMQHVFDHRAHSMLFTSQHRAAKPSEPFLVIMNIIARNQVHKI